MPPPDVRRGGPEEPPLVSVLSVDRTSVTVAVDGLPHMTRRLLQDAVNEALAATWERRAAAFLAARPRPGDYRGRATDADLRQRWQRLTEVAQACRARAAVSRRHEGIDADVEAVAVGGEAA